MKLKKWSLAVISLLAAIVLWNIPTSSQAVSNLATPLYLGVQEFRNNTDPANMAYGIGNPDRNGSTPESMVGAKIWDIVS